MKVVELASFSRAAEELHVSQPSVSAYVSSLEKELGILLINRTTKVISTTLAGERFLESARKMLWLKRETADILGSLSEDISGEIRVLASSMPAVYILPKLIAGFHRLYPEISFNIRGGDTAKVAQGIAAHKADIGFAGSVLGEGKCDFYEFATEKLVVIAPPDSHYNEDKEYSIQEVLYGSSFVSREIGSGTRTEYEKFFDENGIVPDKIKIAAGIDSTHGIVNAVAHGLGVSIVSELAAAQKISLGELKQIKINSPLPVRKIYAVLNKSISHSHLTQLLMDYIRREV